MADERMSDREIRDRFESIDKRMDRMVPLDTWTLQIGHDRDKFGELDRDCRERTDDVEKAAAARSAAIEKAAAKRSAAIELAAMGAIKEIKEGKQNAWVRALQLAGVVATVVVGWWTAYIASKGIK